MIRKSTAQNAWDAQQYTPFNRHASKPMEIFRREGDGTTYEELEYDTVSGKMKETRKMKYNPTCAVPQEELDNCAHKFLIDEANNAGEDPLVAAAADGGAAADIRLLVAAGAAVNGAGGGCSALIASATFGHVDVVAALLGAQASVNAENQVQQNSLIKRAVGSDLIRTGENLNNCKITI